MKEGGGGWDRAPITGVYGRWGRRTGCKWFWMEKGWGPAWVDGREGAEMRGAEPQREGPSGRKVTVRARHKKGGFGGDPGLGDISLSERGGVDVLKTSEGDRTAQEEAAWPLSN